jgi:hypothetical protein
MKMLTLWMMALANSKSHMYGDADANANPIISILASGACTIYLCYYYELLHIIGFHLENDLTGKTFPSIVHSGPAYRTYECTLRRIHLTSFVQGFFFLV